MADYAGTGIPAVLTRPRSYPAACPEEDAVLEASPSRCHATVGIPVSSTRSDSPPIEVAKATRGCF
eukprot:COSAG01_NODE_7961_length_2975_cov_0.968011_2_plen_66_part_00